MTQTKRFTLGASGDILLHLRLIKEAKEKNNYNFTPQMENIKDLIESPDITIVNQESIIGGEKFGYKGYSKSNYRLLFPKN